MWPQGFLGQLKFEVFSSKQYCGAIFRPQAEFLLWLVRSFDLLEPYLCHFGICALPTFLLEIVLFTVVRLQFKCSIRSHIKLVY